MVHLMVLLLLAVTVPKVTDIQVVSKTSESVTIAWQKVSSATQYQIKVLDSDQQKLMLVKAKKAKKEITGLSADTVYSVQVRAVKRDVKGKWSKLKKIRTAAASEEDENDDDAGEDNDDASDDSGGTFTLTSSAFVDTGSIPATYTCDGVDINPALSWSNTPSGTQSFFLAVLDADAENSVHWGVKNISATATGVAEDTVPSGGTEFLNDFGLTGWNGPCPPPEDGAHSYVFTLYALDTSSLSSSTMSEALTELTTHTLGSASLTGEYDLN